MLVFVISACGTMLLVGILLGYLLAPYQRGFGWFVQEAAYLLGAPSGYRPSWNAGSFGGNWSPWVAPSLLPISRPLAMQAWQR